MHEIELTGKVVLQKFGEGSKSEHDALYLDTGNKKYHLLKKGDNPFENNSLHKLIGKIIKVRGYYFTQSTFKITSEPEELK
jgi:UDP-glucose 6-dehydrogenase